MSRVFEMSIRVKYFKLGKEIEKGSIGIVGEV